MKCAKSLHSVPSFLRVQKVEWRRLLRRSGIMKEFPVPLALVLLLVFNVFLSSGVVADDAADQYDYESLNSFKDIERVGRQATRRNQISLTASTGSGGGDDGDHHHHHAKIEKLNVQCSQQGIQVTVDFDSPFDGLIYSRGHFSDPKCRYVEANSRSQTFSFLVPSQWCGTQNDNLSSTLSNILIFQMDETVQEIWDTAKKVSCQTGGQQVAARKQGKMVIFKPLTVGMLDVQHHKMSPTDALDCWMDIQKGAFPNVSPKYFQTSNFFRKISS